MSNPKPQHIPDPGSAKHTALGRWQELSADRRGFILRTERYAAVTIPKVCLPDDIKQTTESIQHDYQSVGAQATNHLTNKLMLAMFAPSRPFFRLDPSTELSKQLAANNITEDQLRTGLVEGEQRAIRVLDQRAVRPKLYETLRHLIITGNVLLDMTDDALPRVIALKRYAVKRSISGRLIEILIHERVMYDELEDEVKEAVPGKQGKQPVDFLRWYRWSKGRWHLTVHVDSQQLPDAFGNDWAETDFPVHVLTWDLADEHDYGTGLVEDYSGDFGTLSTLSEAEVKSAILSSDYRWLANPSGITDLNAFKQSVTGDVIAGQKDDLTLVAMVSGNALEQIGKTADKFVQRIGRAFLLGTAVTRDAERVTAEEIRMQANELETALGGVYSRLAVELQLPLVRWLLKAIDVTIEGTKLEPTIVTGLAALSRAADASQLKQFLADASAAAQMPEQVLIRLQWENVLGTLAAASGLNATKYVRPEAEVQQDLAAQRQAEADAQAQGELAKAGAQAAANPQE